MPEPSAPPADATSAPPRGTLDETIRRRAREDGSRPFITFLADGDRDEKTLTFAELERRALCVAGGLARRGLVPGDRVLVMLPTGLGFIETFFGIALAGMVAVPVYPPARLTRLEHYLRTLASISETSSCRAAVLDERLVPLVGKHVAFHQQKIVTDVELALEREPARPFALEPESPAFLQFTSGTTSQPRGVLLLHRQVQAQLEAYSEALGVKRGEVVVSWLPLYHDLGLVGMVIATLQSAAHLVLLSPVDFLRDPMTWLRALSRFRGVHTAAPNFAYELAVRKCSAERLAAEKIDLASIDNMGMGGEPVSWTTVERFRAHMAPFGFRGQVLNPCYGLAENTLVATGHRRGEPLRTVTLSQRGLQENDVREPASPADATTLVGNGRPFPGMSIRIVGPALDDLGERRIGEVWVQSPSLAAGYFGDQEATDVAFVERDGVRWLRTGDLGFLAGAAGAPGDLYICGRRKDLMIVRGRNFHPQDIEQEAGAVAGVRTGNVVAFSVERGGGQGEAAVVVAELDPKAPRPADEVRRAVIEAVSSAFELALAEVLLLPSGSIPKTSSGKLQRGLVKDAYVRGDLATFAPPGKLATNLLKLRLAWGSFAQKLRPRASSVSLAGSLGAATDGGDLDPRFGEALRRVRPEAVTPLAPALRVDALGLDSLERVELWLQLARLFDAKVPEQELSASQTLGELQTLLVKHEGTGAGAADAGDESSLLVRELLAPASEPFPAFTPPRSAALVFGLWANVTRACWGLRAEGLEYVAGEKSPGLEGGSGSGSRSGFNSGFILAGNHESYLDPAWLRQVVPAEVRDRLVAFNWAGAPAFTRPFLAQMQTIPIDAEKSFHLAIRAGLQALAAGRVLLIFPEGGRTHSGHMTPFRPGVGFLSLLAQRPIVPFRVRGMFDVYPRDKALPRFTRRRGQPDMSVRFGPALVPPPLEAPRAWSQARELVRGLRTAVEGL